MRQVLWPKYLLGGFFSRGGGGISGDAEEGRAGGALRGAFGRWPDADDVLRGGMSDGLRDWDLWYVVLLRLAIWMATDDGRGPLLFSLLLAFLLSRGVDSDQKTVVFSGVFAITWIGKAAVTAQIRLLGGHV